MSNINKLHWIFIIVLVGCSTENKPTFTVDKQLREKYDLVKSKAEHSFSNAFWLFFDSSDQEDFFGKSDPLVFLDTTQYLMDGICDCKILNDTIHVQGGIGYIGGTGYDLKIFSKDYEGKTWVTGEKIKTINSDKYLENIVLNSDYQKLIIEEIDSLTKGAILLGELTMMSEEYLIKGENTKRKMYMKIFFECELDDFIAF